jgi:hypothetical protein
MAAMMDRRAGSAPKVAQASPGPVSVALPTEVRDGLAREARRRGLPLSTTVRALAVERMQQLEEEQELARAEAWQRARAWATWDRIRGGDRREVTRADLRAVFERASRRRRS